MKISFEDDGTSRVIFVNGRRVAQCNDEVGSMGVRDDAENPLFWELVEPDGSVIGAGDVNALWPRFQACADAWRFVERIRS